MQLAADHNCRSIAFPNISTGIYKFPKDKAAVIAVNTVIDFLSEKENIKKIIFVCFDDDNYYWLKRNLNYKVFTVPAKLYADKEVLGNVNIGLADETMGVLSGRLEPNENYTKYRDFLRNTLTEGKQDNLIRINTFTKENNFKVIIDDGTELKEPFAGLIIYDFENEPIEVELNGIDNELWKKYYI